MDTNNAKGCFNCNHHYQNGQKCDSTGYCFRGTLWEEINLLKAFKEQKPEGLQGMNTAQKLMSARIELDKLKDKKIQFIPTAIQIQYIPQFLFPAIAAKEKEIADLEAKIIEG